MNSPTDLSSGILESPFFLQKIINSINDLVVVIDREYRVALSNWQGHDFVPQSTRDGHPCCYEAFLQRVTPCENCHLPQLFATGKTQRIETFNPIDGTTKEVIASPIRDEQGEVVLAIEIVRDITARKEAEETLRNAEATYRSIYNAVNDAVFVHDRDTGLLVDVSDRACEMFGFSREEFIANPPTATIANEGISTLGNAMALLQRAAAGEPQLFEWQARHKGGQIFWVEVNLRSAEINGEQRVLAVVRDISERKEVLEALRASEEKFSKAFQCAPLLMTISSLEDGTYLEINNEFLRISGFSRAEVIGRSSMEIGWISTADRDRLVAAIRSAGRVAGIELSLRARDGHEVLCSYFGELIMVAGRQRLLSIALDITEHRLAERALQQSEQLYRSLVETSPNSVTVSGTDGRIQMANRQALAIFGHENVDEVLGRHLLEWVTPEELSRAQELFAHILAGNLLKSVEIKLLRTGFGPFWAEVSASRSHHPDPAQDRLIVIVSDISTRKGAEQQIRQLNEDLEARVRERTGQLESALHDMESFSYSISHDLRTPLRAVAGYSQILLEDFGPRIPDEGRTFLEKISRSVVTMGQLIDDLLTFSRLSRQGLHREPVDTARLVRGVLHDLRHEQEGRQVEVIIGDLPTCQADPALLRQVFVNLLANALKFTRQRDHARIEIGCRQEDGSAVWFVRDNGAGFDMTYVHKLFGVFQRLHRHDQFEGTGVGLAIVQNIAQRHGGRAWAEGAVGEGATFFFTLC